KGVVARRFDGKAIDNCGQLKRGANRAVNPAQDHDAARLADAVGYAVQSYHSGARTVIDPFELDDQPEITAGQGLPNRLVQVDRRRLRHPAAKRQDRDAFGTTYRDTKRPTQNL